MIPLSNPDPVFQGRLSQSIPLTASQTSALHTLLTTSAKYKDANGVQLTPIEIFALLNSSSVIANPTAQAAVPLTSISKQSFNTGIGSTLLAAVIALPADNPAKASILSDYQLATPLIGDPVDLTNPLFSAIVSGLVASGAVTQQQVTALLSQPDPAWTPNVVQPADAKTITGNNSLIEIADIIAALSQAG